MKYILLPEPDVIRRLPFYFAVEEYVARHYTDDDYFMGWRVNPTVMLGRNQLIDNEVNTDYCRQNAIDIFRRKSGGGCIYAPPMPARPSHGTCGVWSGCCKD